MRRESEGKYLKGTSKRVNRHTEQVLIGEQKKWKIIDHKMTNPGSFFYVTWLFHDTVSIENT